MSSRAPTADQIIAEPRVAYPEATVACFDPTSGELPRRHLDIPRLAHFLKQLEKAGANAVLIGASTGQGHLRTANEMLEWFTAAKTAHLEKICLMGLLRPEDEAGEIRLQAKAMASAGFAVGFVRPGSNLPSDASPSQIAEHLMPSITALAERGLAIGLYSIPDVSGLPLPIETVLELLKSPYGDRIVAVKITEADYEASTAKFLTHPKCQHLKIVQGWDPHLARALQDEPVCNSMQSGRQVGVTSGPMSFAVYQYIHLLAAADRGDWAEVDKSQAAVTALFASMQDDPQKFADLQRAKHIMGLGQPLTSSVTNEQVERVFVALDGIEREEDRIRLAASLDLMGDGPFHDRLQQAGANRFDESK